MPARIHLDRPRQDERNLLFGLERRESLRSRRKGRHHRFEELNRLTAADGEVFGLHDVSIEKGRD